jgi:hypothetical protein
MLIINAHHAFRCILSLIHCGPAQCKLHINGCYNCINSLRWFHFLSFYFAPIWMRKWEKWIACKVPRLSFIFSNSYLTLIQTSERNELQGMDATQPTLFFYFLRNYCLLFSRRLCPNPSFVSIGPLFSHTLRENKDMLSSSWRWLFISHARLWLVSDY